MSLPKRPTSNFPPTSQRTSSVPGASSSQRPGTLKDALTEARAIAGGGLSRPSTAPSQISATGRKSIWIVDDDAAMRARLKASLEPYYDVIEAKDGMEAVELSSKVGKPAMIVADVVMPRVDGFTFAKIMRGNPVMKTVPIMFVSSRNSPQDVTQALVLGACQYVLKTTPIGEIVSKIRKIVG